MKSERGVGATHRAPFGSEVLHETAKLAQESVSARGVDRPFHERRAAHYAGIRFADGTSFAFHLSLSSFSQNLVQAAKNPSRVDMSDLLSRFLTISTNSSGWRVSSTSSIRSAAKSHCTK